jgi:hypothetical protein
LAEHQPVVGWSVDTNRPLSARRGKTPYYQNQSSLPIMRFITHVSYLLEPLALRFLGAKQERFFPPEAGKNSRRVEAGGVDLDRIYVEGHCYLGILFHHRSRSSGKESVGNISSLREITHRLNYAR